ncbi:mCG140123 [Mus musculus]|nr:mCG140123 [Mus musculus]
MQSHTHRLKCECFMAKGEGSLCVWMEVQPAELGAAEEVEVQYKTESPD